MADHYCATIEILKSDIERYPKLKEVVKNTFYDTDGTLIDNDNWDEASPIASFKDDQARYGHFEDLEDVLIELHIPFDRWTSAYTEGAYYAIYRQDINPDEPIILDGDTCQRTFPEQKLRDIVKDLNINAPTLSIATLAAAGDRFISFLKELKPIRPLKEYDTAPSGDTK